MTHICSAYIDHRGEYSNHEDNIIGLKQQELNTSFYLETWLTKKLPSKHHFLWKDHASAYSQLFHLVRKCCHHAFTHSEYSWGLSFEEFIPWSSYSSKSIMQVHSISFTWFEELVSLFFTRGECSWRLSFRDSKPWSLFSPDRLHLTWEFSLLFFACGECGWDLNLWPNMLRACFKLELRRKSQSQSRPVTSSFM